MSEISVVIPTFNAATFLSEAVASVLAQSLPITQCLIVDDGSTDDTPSIARGFGHPVTYIRKTNGGVASARNAGIAKATGEFIAFLDADDVWFPEKIAKQRALHMARPEIGLSYTGLVVTDEDLSPIAQMHAPTGKVALRNSLNMTPPVMSVAQTGFLPLRVAREVGGFDELMTTSADTDFACRVALRYPVEGVDEPLAYYRSHGAQMHHDLGALEHDMRLLLDSFFDNPDLPPDIAGLHGPAMANLEWTLAVAHYRSTAKGAALRHLVNALRWSPRVPVRKLLSKAMRR